MSTETVRRELEGFFESSEPGVFVLKGKWGTGKTHLIKDIIQEKRKDHKYAYVSLFGVNSIERLTETIFVEMATNTKGVKKFAGSLGKSLEEIGSVLGVPIDAVGRTINLSTEAWMLSAIENSKIVVDDLERRGDDLSVKNLLGFFDQLKEQKQCQIILVFNEGMLDKEALKIFDDFREKVVDRELELAPSVEEIIGHGFKKDNEVTKEVLRQLEVDNIRAVQKIEKFLERLERPISYLSQAVQEEVVKSAVRLGWFYFVRGSSNVPWNFIKEYEGGYAGKQIAKYFSQKDKIKELSEKEKRRRNIQHSYINVVISKPALLKSC